MIKRIVMIPKIFVLQLILFVSLSSCVPKSLVKTETIITPTENPTQTVTVTITPTLEPTQSPDTIAASLGLNNRQFYVRGGNVEETKDFKYLQSVSGVDDSWFYDDHSFQIEKLSSSTFLVDQFNHVPKAIENPNGSWRALDYSNADDAEIMYGNLVPMDGTYIEAKWKPLYPYTDNPKVSDLNLRYLGDWETDSILYKGKEIHLLVMLAGLRDGEGKIHIVRLIDDSYDVTPIHATVLNCFAEKGTSSIFDNVEFLHKSLLVGETISTLLFKDDAIKVPNYSIYSTQEPEISYFQYIFLANLYNAFPKQLQLSATEKNMLKKSIWPDRIVTLVPSEGLQVDRDLLSDCNGTVIPIN